MINLNSITHMKSKRPRYALPGGIMTDRVYYAMDVLMEIRDLTAKTIEARKARKSAMVTKSGAVVTRKQSSNKRYFLGA